MHFNSPKALLLATWLAQVATPRPFSPPSSANAIFFLTNDATNAVVAVPISSDGKLSGGTVTPTGGAGSNSVNAMTGEPDAPDALIGQSALAVSGQHVFAVNAGSNTLTMLTIDRADPTKLTILGQPVPVQGEFPNTVAISQKHRLACVGTTGAQNGVSCAPFSREGLGQFDGLRSFGLNQTTPPEGPTNSVSQLLFSEDESALFATVKGNPAVNTTGFFSTFPVQTQGKQASVSTQDVRSSPHGTAVLFGSKTIPGTSSVFVTDASFGAAILSVNPADGEAALVAKQTIEGQRATCWATISSTTSTAFVTDVLRERLVEMSLSDASILSITDLNTGAPGLLDLEAVGDMIYVLSPGNGSTPAAVSVMDASGGGAASVELVQQFDVSGLGVGPNAQGMAVLRP